MSPAGTLCFDIFSPPSGDSDVISHVDLLSSNEMNIAPRSLRIAFGASGRSAAVCMVVSRVGGRNLTLPERRSLSTSPWDLEGRTVAQSAGLAGEHRHVVPGVINRVATAKGAGMFGDNAPVLADYDRSEEHTSELQSHRDSVS